MLKKILIPIDSSETSYKAIKHVKEIASKTKAEVLLVFAYQLPVQISGMIEVYDYEYIENMHKRYSNFGKSILDDVSSELEDLGIKTEKIIKNGLPAKSIVDVVRSEFCDSVIIGIRELNPIERYLMGSVSNFVLHHVDCPVMLIH